MNGSRSNTPNYGSKSSLDQLNRTIEGLEARIQGLVSERKNPPARPQPQATSPVDEIIERQRMLGGARERAAAALERKPRYEAPARAQQGWSEPERHAVAPQQTAALGDIAATLNALRSELKHSVHDTLALDLSEIRSDMRSLRKFATEGSSDLVREELARLGDSIDRLGAANRNPHMDDLRAELEDLRTMTAGLAREESLRSLEKRWDRTEKKLSAVDPDALKEEMVQLAWRIDGIKSALGEMSAAPAVRALEDKLIALASSIEVLGRNVETRDDLSGQFSSLDRRLDEISRAIAASTAQGTASTDTAAFHRLENRIAELTTHVDMLQPSSRETDIAGRIEALTERIEELANEDAVSKLEDRIDQLSRLIERNFREDIQSPAISGHLADISRKIDGLGGSQGDALASRLDMLAQKLEEFERPPEASPLAMADLTAMSRLESRLVDIAARLDESAVAPAADTNALRNLENQIAALSSLIGQSSGLPALDSAASRIPTIEEYMATSDEFIVEAARQAAEAVVEAYARNGSLSQAHPADISAIAGLAEDLRALEAHTRQSEERTADTFSALHQTLVQIAGRLDDLGDGVATHAPAAREPVREPQAEPVRMPKAPQPDFASFAAEPEEAPAYAPPRHAKVDILQDEQMLADAADADIAADTMEPIVDAPERQKPQSKSLIAGLAARLKPGKREMPTSGRVSVDPTPALDAGDVIVADDSAMLLEPGSGVPDVKKIMEKVRAGQKTGAAAGKAAPAGQADVIAAARRAAQAAAQEAGAQKLAQPDLKDKGTREKGAKPARESKSILGAAGETRRPILLAAAAVLLVVMSYPLVSGLIGSRHTAAKPEQPASIVTPTEQNSSAADPVELPSTDKVAAAPADQASLDVTPRKIETGAEKLMTPAEDTDGAATLTKPMPASPVDDTASATEDAAAPLDRSVAPAEAQATEPVAKNDISADAKPATTDAAPVGLPALPAGLQPASLVEAVKKADPLAYFEIGSRYTDGRGVKVDLAAAAQWYQLAAGKGFAPAEYRLASLYEKGTGVTRDLAKARSLYLAAAEKGNASAMHNLAVLYATGASGTPDFNEAARWFQSAAELDVRDSQFNLAILYARGSGVQQDLTESYKWFGIAARQGDQDAAQKRDEVANAMSADQLKAAKAKLDLWKPKALDDAANSAVVPDEWAAKSNTTAAIDMKRAIRNIQAILNNNGFDAGKPDGEMGKKTVLAIKAFQKSVGQEPTGRIDDALVKELLKRNKKA